MLHKWVWWEVGCLMCASACAAAAVYQACLCEPSFGGSGAGSEAASTEGQDGAVLPRAGRGVGASSAGRAESPPFRDTFILFRSECGRSDVCNAHPCCPVHPGNALKATPGVQRGCACCHFCRGCFLPGGPHVVDQEPCSAAVGARGRGRNGLVVPDMAAQTHA